MSKPRHGARVDKVQPAIVWALRERGARVLVLDVGEDGAPDLLVGWLGRLTLLELKSPGGRLSEAQKAWHASWAMVGVKVHPCKTVPEALRAVGIDTAGLEAQRRALHALIPPEVKARMHLRSSVRQAVPARGGDAGAKADDPSTRPLDPKGAREPTP